MDAEQASENLQQLAGVSMNLQEFSSHLEGVVKHPSDDCKLKARCPAHDDKKPSLVVTEADDRLLVYCYAGCYTNDILNAMGLRFQDLFLNTNLPPADRQKGLSRAMYMKILAVLHYELVVLMCGVNSRLEDHTRLKVKNWQECYPALKPMPAELWDRELDALQRIIDMMERLK